MHAKNLHFEHELFESKKLERTEENGKRLYVTESGERFPSVTTVLSYLSRNHIKKWRNKVGHEEASKISTQASRSGTAMHTVAEKYVLNDDTWRKENPVSVDRFLSIKPYLDEHVTTIYGSELQMYSTELQTAGTADLICSYKNKNTILDFKTSRRQKKKEDILNYFIQCTAYALMTKEHYDFNVEQLVILMSVGDGTACVFEEDISPYIQMTKKFFQLYHEGKLQ